MHPTLDEALAATAGLADPARFRRATSDPLRLPSKSEPQTSRELSL